MLKRAKEQAEPAEKGKILEGLLTKFEGTEWAKKAEELKP